MKTYSFHRSKACIYFNLGYYNYSCGSNHVNSCVYKMLRRPPSVRLLSTPNMNEICAIKKKNRVIEFKYVNEVYVFKVFKYLQQWTMYLPSLIFWPSRIKIETYSYNFEAICIGLQTYRSCIYSQIHFNRLC